MTLESRLWNTIRSIEDFPSPGVSFKDITPLLRNAELCSQVADAMSTAHKGHAPDYVAGIESRGFLFGMLLAERLNCGFIAIRKKGKLPAKTISMDYGLEYGRAILEIHADEILPGQKVLIHDDILATGGTAEAAAKLIALQGGTVCGFSFIVELKSFEAEKKLQHHSQNIVTLIKY